MTTDRVSGVALAALALLILEESHRLRLPLGAPQDPGPAYVPVLLALMLIRLHLVARELLAIPTSSPGLPTVKKELERCAELRRTLIQAGWLN